MFSKSKKDLSFLLVEKKYSSEYIYGDYSSYEKFILYLSEQLYPIRRSYKERIAWADFVKSRELFSAWCRC